MAAAADWGAVRKGDDIANRLLALGVGVIQIADSAPKTPHARHVVMQLVRAASGAGANYEEARRAETRADFIHKMGIASKEVAETAYWLRLIKETRLAQHNVDPALREADDAFSVQRSAFSVPRSRTQSATSRASNGATRAPPPASTPR